MLLFRDWTFIKIRQTCKNLGLSLKQAGAELGQAQLKLKLDLTLTVCRFGFNRFGLLVIIGLILF